VEHCKSTDSLLVARDISFIKEPATVLLLPAVYRLSISVFTIQIQFQLQVKYFYSAKHKKTTFDTDLNFKGYDFLLMLRVKYIAGFSNQQNLRKQMCHQAARKV